MNKYILATTDGKAATAKEAQKAIGCPVQPERSDMFFVNNTRP